ncbi:HlyC/CorC family transporter [PVC group bacterium]|nr:HlyC/CorC family transporter [PVC group bacterium]
MIYVGIEIALFAIFLVLSACFSGTETALFSLNKIQLGRLRRKKDKINKRVISLLESPQKLLSTILLGNTLFNVCATAIFTTLLVSLIGVPWGGVVSMIVMPCLLLFFGEITPKMFAIRYPVLGAQKFSIMIEGFMKLTAPFQNIIEKFISFVLRIFGIKKFQQDLALTEDEFVSLVDISEKKGIVEEDEREMITNWIDCSDIDVKEIMTPRVEMVAFDVNTPRAQVKKEIKLQRYKHYPVYRDKVDNIIGVIQVKEWFFNPDKDLIDLVRPGLFVPDTKKIDELICEMQRDKQHVALVVDEHGGIDGIVSIIDIVEEITGDIPDEYDVPDQLIKKIESDRMIVKGNLRVADANEILELNLPQDDEDYDTVAGFLLKQMGKIPKKGEKTEYKNLRFTIRRATRLKIVSVLIEKIKRSV